jgi:hypothetical protein
MAFWDSFASIGERHEASWLCIGDFNFILVQSEKQGGRPLLVPLTTLSKVPLITLVWWI